MPYDQLVSNMTTMDSENVPFSKYSQGDKKANLTQGSSIDDGVMKKCSSIISLLRDEGASKDFRPLIECFQKGLISQVVQVWSYYAQVNNHAKFSEASTLLLNTLRLLGSDKNVHEYGTVLIKLVLSGHAKVLYRGLNNIRASITNPILRLMKEMVSFNSGQHVEDFVSSFDFSLHSLPKILTVNKADLSKATETSSKNSRLSIRFAFLQFWLTLISYSPPLLRKDLIFENFKIMSAWFKYMDKVDTIDLIDYTLDVLTEKILGEKVFKRMTKTKILNELVLSKIHSFYYFPDKNLVKKVNEFFLAYGSDPETSVAFPDDCVWFSDSPISGSHRGVVVTINQKEFKIYNKLLLNILKCFKPWEDDMQSTTVLKILEHVPELVAPYCHFLASHGVLEPKMTSYWFGCTMVIGRIIQLQIPKFIQQVQTDTFPSNTIVMQSLLPAPLSKIALTKSLQHESLIIRQLTCHLLIFSFKKLEQILQWYDRKGWISAKAALRNAFYINIPDLSVIMSSLNQAYILDRNNKILQLSLTIILKHYSKAFPNFFTINLPSDNVYVDVMHNKKFSGMDLTILDNFLQYQELNGMQTKWWNMSFGEHSLFTSLLNLAKNSTEPVAEKICKLLDDMFRGTIVFNKLLCSSQEILVHSLQVFSGEEKQEEMTKIWKLLDEAVGRCMRTPYRYVDMSESYGRISPFIMALAEQWNYMDKSSSFDLPAKWICLYMRIMAICGESQEGLITLAETLFKDIPEEYIKSNLNFNQYSKTSAKLLNAPYSLSNISGSSFFEYVTLLPYSKLSKITRNPITALDALGLQFRMELLLIDESVNYDTAFKDTAHNLLAKMANYAIFNTHFEFINDKIVELLFNEITHFDGSKSSSLKSIFIAHWMIYINYELGISSDNFEDFAFKWLQNNCKFLHSTDINMVEFISRLCNCLNGTHSLHLLQSNERINILIVKTILRKLLIVKDMNLPFTLLLTLLKNASMDSIELASELLKSQKIEDMEAQVFLSLALEEDYYAPAIESFLYSPYYSLDSLIPYLDIIKERNIALIVALRVCGSDRILVKKFLQHVVEKSYHLLEKSDISSSQKALELFCSCPDMLSEVAKSKILQYITSEYNEKYSAPVVQFVNIVASFEDEFVLIWLNKLILYVTKSFSGCDHLTEGFSTLLFQLEELTKSVNIWQYVSASILNAHLEVIINGRWITNSHVLKYIAQVSLAGNAATTECGRMMQCLLNNENNELLFERSEKYSRFLTATLLYIFFMMDPSQSSNVAVQERLLQLYSGTVSSEDKLIFEILEIIESKTSLSWTNDICAWDLLEGENGDTLDYVRDTKLITKEKEGFVVTLSKDAVKNTAENYVLNRPDFSSVRAHNTTNSWETYVSFFHKTEAALHGAHGVVYDPMFLMLLTVHNNDLVKRSLLDDGSTKYVFIMKKFLSSNIFQVIICALSDEPKIQAVAISLISGMLDSLEENIQSKDGHVFKVLLKRIVYTLKELELGPRDKIQPVAPCIWLSISCLSQQLLQPTSPLYEKAYRWVLSAPFIRSNDIPMLQDLMNPPAHASEFENFYKQLGWVLTCLKCVLKTRKDVELLKKIGALEWLLNLMNLPYINARMRSTINSIFYIIQRIDDSGSTLITRFASISHIEIHQQSTHNRIGDVEDSLAKNVQNSRRHKTLLTFKEQGLNFEQILESNLVLIDSQKRLRQWMGGDSENLKKRICR